MRQLIIYIEDSPQGPVVSLDRGDMTTGTKEENAIGDEIALHFLLLLKSKCESVGFGNSIGEAKTKATIDRDIGRAGK